jgi:hypothetical protein
MAFMQTICYVVEMEDCRGRRSEISGFYLHHFASHCVGTEFIRSMTESIGRWTRKKIDMELGRLQKILSERLHHVTSELKVSTGKISSGHGRTSAPENAHISELHLCPVWLWSLRSQRIPIWMPYVGYHDCSSDRSANRRGLLGSACS